MRISSASLHIFFLAPDGLGVLQYNVNFWPQFKQRFKYILHTDLIGNRRHDNFVVHLDVFIYCWAGSVQPFATEVGGRGRWPLAVGRVQCAPCADVAYTQYA